MLQRRILGGVLGLALALGVVACELTIGLDPYQAGCPAGEKACTDPTTNTKACVNIGNPNYGCTPTGCESCDARATPNTVPQAYSCGTTGCVAGVCPFPWQNCDRTLGYCESNSNIDKHNCGNCGTDCTTIQVTTNATQTGPISCVQGGCKVTSCQMYYADCNGIASDGCEVQLNASNCWSCPVRVPAGMTAPPCPCRDCYISQGSPGVCPVCHPGNTCNTSSMQCE